jgi:hypothetical protein
MNPTNAGDSDAGSQQRWLQAHLDHAEDGNQTGSHYGLHAAIRLGLRAAAWASGERLAGHNLQPPMSTAEGGP